LIQEPARTARWYLTWRQPHSSIINSLFIFVHTREQTRLNGGEGRSSCWKVGKKKRKPPSLPPPSSHRWLTLHRVLHHIHPLSTMLFSSATSKMLGRIGRPTTSSSIAPHAMRSFGGSSRSMASVTFDLTGAFKVRY